MTLRSSDLQSDSDLDSIRNSCNVFSIQFLFWYTTKTLVASPMGQLYITDAALNHPPPPPRSTTTLFYYLGTKSRCFSENEVNFSVQFCIFCYYTNDKKLEGHICCLFSHGYMDTVSEKEKVGNVDIGRPK